MKQTFSLQFADALVRLVAKQKLAILFPILFFLQYLCQGAGVFANVCLFVRLFSVSVTSQIFISGFFCLFSQD